MHHKNIVSPYRIRHNPNKLIQKTATITSGPNGQFSIQLLSAELDINPDTYVYDIFRTSPGNARILSLGSFIVGEDVRYP